MQWGAKGPTQSNYTDLKRLMTTQTGGDEKRSAVRTLSFAILWCLECKIDNQIVLDLLDLLRFEHERRVKERDSGGH